MVLLPGSSADERQYMERTKLLATLEHGVEAMLRACAESQEDPINFLATWLMRHNPRHNTAFAERLASAEAAESPEAVEVAPPAPAPVAEAPKPSGRGRSRRPPPTPAPHAHHLQGALQD